MRQLIRAKWRPLLGVRPRYLSFTQRRTLRKLHPNDQRSKYDQKVDDANNDWQQRAEAIRNGEHDSMLSILEGRGYVNAIAGNRDELDNALTTERIAAYAGIDPTAPSLHLGHLLPMMVLLWLYLHGYEVVVLLGGATASVGDPSGRTSSRESLSTAKRRANVAAMHVQLKRLWKKMENHAIQKHGFKWQWAWRRNLWNNSEWLGRVPIQEFMSHLGTGTRLGPLLSRDTIKTRIENGDGVSFAELSYPLLQAWDWWHMFKSKGVSLQIGGADQFGNIISGIESLNHLRKNAPSIAPNLAQEYKGRKFFGLTVPLLTTSAGEKFGKSAGNAIWLDEDLTTPMELYQFLLRSSDADVERYLRLFTLSPLSEISTLMEKHDEDRAKRNPQRQLARELVKMVHGENQVNQIERELGLLFKGYQSAPTIVNATSTNSQTSADAQQPITAENAGGSRSYLPRSAVVQKPFSSIFHAAGLATSRKEAHRLIAAGGAYVGSQPGQKNGNRGGMTDSLKFTPVMLWKAEETQSFIIDDSVIILRAGKWKVKIVTLLPDSEYVERGLPPPPGWEPSEAPLPDVKVLQ